MKKRISAVLTVCMALVLTTPVFSQTMTFAPNVTEEMCSADHWISKLKDPNAVLLSPEKLSTLNKSIRDTAATNMYDLENLPETFNGIALSDALAKFENPSYPLYMNKKEVTDEFYNAIRQNISNAEASEKMSLRYAVSVNYSMMKAYPYDGFLSDSLDTTDWDDLMNSAVNVNEPLVMYFKTADGKFAYVKSNCCSGWVKSDDIAICSSKEEWLKDKNDENILVVTGEKVYLEYGLDTPESSGKMLTMGTVLPLLNDGETPDEIGLRASWNSYCVLLPCRDENGMFVQKPAFVPQNRDVSVGYLPFTQANIISQAFKCLGNRYGWGGMLAAADCSSFVKNVYKCCGADVARNTTWQAAMPVNVLNIEGFDEENKKLVYNNLPAGAVLYFRGHEVLYLGCENGKYYCIDSLGSIMTDGKEKFVNTVVVNDISVKRRNGNTWFDEFKKAIVLWQ